VASCVDNCDWIGISIAGAFYSRRVIKLGTGVQGLEWCVNLAKMAQVSMVAYMVGGSFLSLSYWDYYFTILVEVKVTKRFRPRPIASLDLNV
jgi:hypothetical protein